MSDTLKLVDCPKFNARVTLDTCVRRYTLPRTKTASRHMQAGVREACRDCATGKQRAEAQS